MFGCGEVRLSRSLKIASKMKTMERREVLSFVVQSQNVRIKYIYKINKQI